MIQPHLDTMPCHLNYAIYGWWTLCRAIRTMPFMIDDSISFGHYAVPFDLCHLWLMIQFHLDTMPCHLIYAFYDWWLNFIWTLCRAIWTMPFMIQFHLDTMPCHLTYDLYDWWPPSIWTLCRAIWTMPFMIDDSISFGHYAVPLELCHYDWWFNFTWTLCRAIWTMLVMSGRTNFIWTLCRAFWTMPAYELWLNLIWTLCRANWTTLICDWCFNAFGQ